MMLALLFLAGLGLLLLGAELLVRGASRLALALGLAPVIVGLTVVSIGTSAPEMAISIGGALAGTPDLALGNIVAATLPTCCSSSDWSPWSHRSWCIGNWSGWTCRS